jgi:hypothetical protein
MPAITAAWFFTLLEPSVQEALWPVVSVVYWLAPNSGMWAVTVAGHVAGLQPRADDRDEIDPRARQFRPGHRVVDRGAGPHVPTVADQVRGIAGVHAGAAGDEDVVAFRFPVRAASATTVEPYECAAAVRWYGPGSCVSRSASTKRTSGPAPAQERTSSATDQVSSRRRLKQGWQTYGRRHRLHARNSTTARSRYLA